MINNVSGGEPSDPRHEMKDIEVERRFSILRASVQKGMRIELLDRIATNPEPTTLENSIGIYIQSIEPQVRHAALMLLNGGWRTGSSGFGGPKRSRHQHLQFSGGVFLDERVRREVEESGAELHAETYPDHFSYQLFFQPEEPDADAIASQWDRISASIPNIGPAYTSQRSHWTDRAFVINALNVGMSADELTGSPFATEDAVREAMQMYGFTSREQHKPLV